MLLEKQRNLERNRERYLFGSMLARVMINLRQCSPAGELAVAMIWNDHRIILGLGL